MISKIEVERFTLSSSKPFDQVRLTSRNGKNAELSIFDVWCSDPNSTVRSAGMTFSTSKNLLDSVKLSISDRVFIEHHVRQGLALVSGHGGNTESRMSPRE